MNNKTRTCSCYMKLIYLKKKKYTIKNKRKKKNTKKNFQIKIWKKCYKKIRNKNQKYISEIY